MTGPPLYKYLNPAHAADLLNCGKLRVGSLEYYRSIEGVDPLRTDAGEGHLHFVEGQLGPQRGDQLSPFARRFVPAAGPGQTFMANIFELHHEHPNCLIYCMSYELSQSAAGNYTACIRIKNPNDFLDCITSEVAKIAKIASRDRSRIVYADRVQPGTAEGRLNPAFVKPTRYEVEREVRAIWLLSDRQVPEFLHLTIPHIVEHLEPADIPGKSRDSAA